MKDIFFNEIVLPFSGKKVNFNIFVASSSLSLSPSLSLSLSLSLHFVCYLCSRTVQHVEHGTRRYSFNKFIKQKKKATQFQQKRYGHFVVYGQAKL